MRCAILCLVLTALPVAANAEELSFFDKMQLKQACEKDVEALCGSVERGEGRMLQCIRESADKLSQPCHDAVAMLRSDLLVGEPMDY